MDCNHVKKDFFLIEGASRRQISRYCCFEVGENRSASGELTNIVLKPADQMHIHLIIPPHSYAYVKDNMYTNPEGNSDSLKTFFNNIYF